MIEGNHYITLVKSYFNFLVTEFAFKVSEEQIRGNAFYDVAYGNDMQIVSSSYENIEDYFQVIIFMLKNGERPDYDDKVRTLHLNKLNAQLLSGLDKKEIALNNEFFLGFNPNDEIERRLLKAAQELRLCLKHF